MNTDKGFQYRRLNREGRELIEGVLSVLPFIYHNRAHNNFPDWLDKNVNPSDNYIDYSSRQKILSEVQQAGNEWFKTMNLTYYIKKKKERPGSCSNSILPRPLYPSMEENLCEYSDKV